jgi:hypothetical protein
LRGDIFGFPSLSFGDGLQQQDGTWWDVGVSGCGAFPHIQSVFGALRGLDTGLFEKLPNKRATLSPVVIQGPGRVTM